MPYARNADLPAGVRNALPAAAQTTFRTILNAALEQYEDDEGKAFATAWAGLRRAGWTKEGDEWVKAEKSWALAGEIRKTDDDQRLVFGWLSVAVDKSGAPVVDLQGDMIPVAELEKAAYDFVLYVRKAGEMHQRTDGIGHMVESMVFTVEKQQALGIPEGTLPVGWWVGFRIADDEVWKRIKSGEYRAFSIGGTGIREEVNDGA